MTEVILQQLLKVWTQLDMRRKIIVVVATLAMFGGILGMSRIASGPSMTLLYSGLESGAAGEVVRALEQRGIAFEVRGGSIFVDAVERDQLRLTLASEGLPANGNNGYELLDSLTGFGTTSQMFDAAYWRAKEGELARTIVANPQIASARVHIASTGSNPFQRGVTPKASVSITPTNGSVTSAQAKAVRYLVASAVAGLSPEDVAVIDANGTLVGQGDEVQPTIVGDDKAQVLKDRVQRLLEARVGYGNAVVEVSVDTVTESESVRERRFDPEGRVAISTDTEERSNTSQDAGDGDVTVASNLPDQEGGNGDSSSSSNSESRKRINYEVSETEREIIRAPGAIKRLTVAVLVNETAVPSSDDVEAATPRDAAELAALRELVEAAVGYDAERGDVITIKSMQLQAVPNSGTELSASLLSQMNIDAMALLQMAILALVTLILGLFVIRPVLSRRSADPELTAPAMLPAVSEDSDVALEALSGEIDPGDGLVASQPAAIAGEGEGIPENTEIAADPVDRLRALIGERQEETVEILRNWLEEKEENA